MTKPDSKIVLSDDGTMDTVLVCTECREEFRYNYDPEPSEPGDERSDEQAYDDFIDWAIEDAESEHECGGEG